MYKKCLIFLVCFGNSTSGFNRDGIIEKDSSQGAYFAQFVENYAQRKSSGKFNAKDQVALDEQLLTTVRYDAEPGEHNDMLTKLLEMGAAAHYALEEGSFIYTPLWEAISKHGRNKDKDYSASIKTLLDKGAPVRPYDLHAVLCARHEGMSAKRLGLVKTLVIARADVNAPVTLSRNAVLFLAYDNMQEDEACEVFKIFAVHAQPKPELNKGEGLLVEPLEMALQQKRKKLAALYIAAGAQCDYVKQYELMKEAVALREELIKLGMPKERKLCVTGAPSKHS